MDASNPLPALAALERRYDGPIPLELRHPAPAGRGVVFDRLARHAAAALARSRAQGSTVERRIARDLRLYREAGLAWRDLAEASPSTERIG